MISNDLITIVMEFVYEEAEKFGVPSKPQIDFINEKGQWLSEKLKANKEIVLLGTLLMDYKLGQAYKDSKPQEHVEMSAKKAEELLSKDKNINKEEIENILACVREHHGANKFFSLESEICCNADCYKFASVNGVIISLKYLREMPLPDMVRLFLKKAEEKWKALSLDICKKKLKPEYLVIKKFLDLYK